MVTKNVLLHCWFSGHAIDIQYCINVYIQILKRKHIAISTTENIIVTKMR